MTSNELKNSPITTITAIRTQPDVIRAAIAFLVRRKARRVVPVDVGTEPFSRLVHCITLTRRSSRAPNVWRAGVDRSEFLIGGGAGYLEVISTSSYKLDPGVAGS